MATKVKFGVTHITIEECPKCNDPEFFMHVDELKDAEGYAECDLCGMARHPLKDEDYGLAS